MQKPVWTRTFMRSAAATLIVLPVQQIGDTRQHESSQSTDTAQTLWGHLEQQTLSDEADSQSEGALQPSDQWAAGLSSVGRDESLPGSVG